MIDYETSFINTNLAAFPDTEGVNVSAPGAGNGTEWVAAFVNDVWGRAQALMDYAGLSPDGVQEAPGTAQIISAISKGFGVGPGFGVTYWKNDTPLAHGDRVLLLQGQTILISTYAALVAATYCGDANNATAPAFYKTSDSGGTTRSTAGTYFVLPDARGLSLKNIGNAVVNGRTKTGPVKLGEKQEDQMQRVTGSTALNVTAGPVYMDGVFEYIAGASSQSNSIEAINASRTSRFSFDSANSPDARTSTLTTGATRDSALGTNFGITY
jgi:hypothetical protein